jgi:3-oxoacyl-[acyl-carrier-protein] synthase-3
VREQVLTDTPAGGLARIPAGATMGAVGMAVPPTVVPNAAIAERLGVDDRWIVARTGISERRVLLDGETLADLATEAARRALAVADVDALDVDLVLAATASADHFMPNLAPLVAAALGADRAGAMDVGAACTGFLYAVATATAQIEAGRAREVLVIGADRLSHWLDPDDRRTAALFGDGAGAVVMGATAGPSRVGPTVLRADGARAESIIAHREDSILRMEGHDTFKHAVLRLSEVTLQATEAAGLGLEDVDLFVYHQANRRILRSVGQRLGLDTERVVDCVDRYGNTSAASIPIALAEATGEGRLPDGARVLLAAFGSGFTWGGMVVEWGRHA